MASVDKSLYRQFRNVLILISVLVVAASMPALILIERSTGSGGAINVSGSLRMMSYKLTVAVSNPYVSDAARRDVTQAAVAEFDVRLTSQGLMNGIPSEADDPIRRMYEAVYERFSKEIKPLALRSIEDEAARRRFMVMIPSFVDEVDAFVAALEVTLNARLSRLQALLMLTLGGGIVVTLMMLRTMRNRIFIPLKELETTVDDVRHGRFGARTATGLYRNEIGRLGRGFNFMVRELERLYGSLEREVERKTADLDRRNRGLELLAQISVQLFSGGDLLPILQRTLQQAADYLQAAGAAVYLDRPQCRHCLASTANWADTASGTSIEVAFGNEETPPIKGSLVLRLPLDEESAPDWMKHFLTMLGGLIGRAVSSSVRAQDDRRLAVLEERSTIARELHDSIAQTLSFSRIQVVRLKRAAAARGRDKEIDDIIAEIEMGVSTAYRQLREVLTAFRLQVHGTGLAGAVNETVESFRNRTGLPVDVTNAVLGFDFTPNEQIHIMHILGETLANIEKHAQASKVTIRIERLGEGGFSLSVVDDGVGIPDKADKAQHFGLSIMRERAAAMGAKAVIRRREAPEHGTIVRVWRDGRPVLEKLPHSRGQHSSDNDSEI